MRSKRSFGRKRRVARRKVRVRKTARRKSRNLPSTGFGKAKLVKLKYVETVLIDLASTQAGGVYVFKANDIYDPNFTGTGHQPLGHDTYEAIYTHYDVVSSSVKFTVTQPKPSGTSEPANYVVYGKTNTSTTLSNVKDTVLEQPGITRKFLTAGTTKVSLGLRYSMKRDFPTTSTRTQVGSSPGSNQLR